MEPITVNYKVLDARAKVPAYATPGSVSYTHLTLPTTFVV